MAVGRAGQGLPGEPGSGPGWGSRLPHPALCLCPVGVLALLPGSLWCCPAAPPSWLALATGDSLASTQAQATACPSGSLSLSAQGPLGLGSRSGQSGLSPVPEPDGQSADRITASPGPRPPPPTVGPGSCLGRRNPLMGPSTGLPCSARVRSVSLPLVPWAGRVSPSPEPQFPLDDVSVWNCGNLGASSSAGPMAGDTADLHLFRAHSRSSDRNGNRTSASWGQAVWQEGCHLCEHCSGPRFSEREEDQELAGTASLPRPSRRPLVVQALLPALSGGDGEPGPGPAEGTLAVAAEEKLGREGGCQPAPWSPSAGPAVGAGPRGGLQTTLWVTPSEFPALHGPSQHPRGCKGRGAPLLSFRPEGLRIQRPQSVVWPPGPSLDSPTQPTGPAQSSQLPGNSESRPGVLTVQKPCA